MESVPRLLVSAILTPLSFCLQSYCTGNVMRARRAVAMTFLPACSHAQVIHEQEPVLVEPSLKDGED
jgi:hypothetical protein